MNYKMGCIPSPRDDRDFLTTAILPGDIPLPRRVMWNVPVILNQGKYGSCVGFGTAGLKNAQETAQNDYVEGGFSPLFIYSMCKQMDGIPNQEGTYIRLGMKVLVDYGIPPEKSFPYSLLQSPLGFPPVPDAIKTSAAPYKIKTFAVIPPCSLGALKQALTVSPVVAGVSVFPGFYSHENGFLPTPTGPSLGGHCIYFCGYDDDLTHTYADGTTKTGFVKFPNSWDTTWGDNGYGYIAYEDLYGKVDNFIFTYEAWSSIDIIVNPTPETKKYYKVQVGAFRVKENCENFVIKVKAAGFPTYMPPVDADGLYRVQCGAFSIKENAEALKAKMIAKGFTGAFIVYK